MCFHVTDKLELCAGTIQVLSRTMYSEVMVTFQIIGQETHAAFQCHQFSSPRESLNLQWCQGISCNLKESFCVSLKKFQREVYFCQIRFILGTVICTETDRITIIVGCQTRHDGIQINDAECVVCFIIQKNVV